MARHPRKLSDWLGAQPAAIRQILSRSEQLTRINRSLLDWLQQPWADAVRLTRLDADAAVFTVSNAAASTRLRFHGPQVLEFLRHRFDVTCTRLQILVRPEAYKRI